MQDGLKMMSNIVLPLKLLVTDTVLSAEN